MIKGMYILPLAQMGISEMEEQEKVIDFLIQLAKIGIKNNALKEYKHD